MASALFTPDPSEPSEAAALPLLPLQTAATTCFALVETYSVGTREDRLLLFEKPSRYGGPSRRKRHLPEVGATLRPGQKGTRRLVVRYGEQLLCVRYRYDPGRCVRQTTVELIVSERPWLPITKRCATNAIVGIAVRRSEGVLRFRILKAGGSWDPSSKQWKLRLDRAIALGLEKRIRRARAPSNADPQLHAPLETPQEKTSKHELLRLETSPIIAPPRTSRRQ
jgi:hypothetical protein